MPPVMTVGKAISMLRSAIVNARIYPKGSQMVQSSISGALQALESCLLEASPSVSSDPQGKLFLNAKELAECKAFRPFMIQHEIQSLRFSKGLTLDEVRFLLDGMGRRKGQMDDAPNLGAWLRLKNVTHVEAEEVEFV